MTLDELIVTSRKLLRDVRPERYLFDDDEILLGLNEGQRKFALKTHYFLRADRTLNLEAETDLYPLDADIITVYSCTLDGYYGRLRRSTETWTPDSYSLAKPEAFTTDQESQSIRFFSAPDKDYVATLRVAVLPPEFSLDELDAECQIPLQWQVALCDWAAYRCYSTDDADGRNDDAAATAKKRFEAVISEAKSAGYRAATGPSPRARGDRIK